MILFNIFTKTWSCHHLLWCIIGRPLLTLLCFIRHLIINRHFSIIYIKWGTIMHTSSYLIIGRHLMNRIHMINIRKSLVVEVILSLQIVVVAPLNILITLGVITMIFSVCMIFCLCAPFHFPVMFFSVPLSWKYSLAYLYLSLFYLYIFPIVLNVEYQFLRS